MSLYGSTYGGDDEVDPNPPVVANEVAPTTRTGFFEADVSDDVGLSSVIVLATLGDTPSTWVTIYADGLFRGAFAAYSSVLGLGTTASPFHFRIRPAPRWPVGTNTIRFRLIDGAGNVNA